MKNQSILTFIFILLAVQALIAQNFKERCQTDIFYQQLLKAQPQLHSQQADIEAFTERWIKENQYVARPRMVVKIPVVVHVVWNKPEENISDEQIFSQIEVMNKDFRMLNENVDNTPDEFSNLIADIEIEFCLATRDPDGNPTNGITRTQTDLDSIAFRFVNFTTFQRNIKNKEHGGIDPWDSYRYINIWVGRGDDNLVGDASYPGIAPPMEDGIVIDYRVFGTIGTGASNPDFSGGRTMTHELGHYFNLRHLWGYATSCGDDDCVLDTPVQSRIYLGCPQHPNSSCDSNDMTSNYMNFVNDQCMSFFTKGQKWRMLAALYGPRNGLLHSDGCGEDKESIDYVFKQLYTIYPNPASQTMNVFYLRKDLDFIDMLTLDGKHVDGCAFLSRGKLHTLDLTRVPAGFYIVHIRTRTRVSYYEKVVIVK